MTKQDVIRDIQKVAKGDGLVTIAEYYINCCKGEAR